MAFVLPYTEELLLVLALITIGSICGLIGGVILLWNEKLVRKIAHVLVSFAAGVLLSAAFLDLMPESIEMTSWAWLSCLVGIIFFFVSERALIWHSHVHHENHIKEHVRTYSDSPKKAFGLLLMLGDTIHNFVDGMIIAAAAIISIKLGILTAIAVFFHEIPQEIGDFSVLIYAKFPRAKVFLYNFYSALASFVGGLAVFFLASTEIIENLSPLLAFAAGGFIYIAVSDLLPELKHETRSIKEVLIHLAVLIFGIALIFLLGQFLHAH